MKTAHFGAILAALLVSLGGSLGQGFINLDFEDATVVLDTSRGYYPYAAKADAAFPGWTVGGFLGPTVVFYDAASLGAPAVTLFDTAAQISDWQPLDGTYSVEIYGGSPGGGSVGGWIRQTGLVPEDAQSISFIAVPPRANWGTTTLLVSLGGQNIPFTAISAGPRYTLYAGNIPSGLAGQGEELMFATPLGVNNYWDIDDIQFSPVAVPEPTTVGLLGLVTLSLYWHTRRFNHPNAANPR